VRPLPASGHEEVVPAESALAEGFEDFLDLSAQMRADTDSATLKFPQQGVGHRRAEEHVHRESRDAAGQRLRRQCVENEFLAPDLLSALTRHKKEAGGGVEDWRDALLADGDGDSHDSWIACTVRATDEVPWAGARTAGHPVETPASIR
jgi:hypothetical protein